MEIRQVKINEVKMVQELLKETAEWLKSIESNQWEEILDGNDKYDLSKAIKKEEVYFFYNRNRELAGMFAAWKEPSEWDQLLWKKVGLSQNTYYIHRVIIRPTFRNMNYGNLLLENLKNFFQPKASELRLDCLSSNKKLIEFYTRNDFNNIGSKKNAQGELFELFSYVIDR